MNSVIVPEQKIVNGSKVVMSKTKNSKKNVRLYSTEAVSINPTKDGKWLYFVNNRSGMKPNGGRATIVPTPKALEKMGGESQAHVLVVNNVQFIKRNEATKADWQDVENVIVSAGWDPNSNAKGKWTGFYRGDALKKVSFEDYVAIKGNPHTTGFRDHYES